jgi:hypothetical protein
MAGRRRQCSACIEMETSEKTYLRFPIMKSKLCKVNKRKARCNLQKYCLVVIQLEHTRKGAVLGQRTTWKECCHLPPPNPYSGQTCPFDSWLHPPNINLPLAVCKIPASCTQDSGTYHH